MQFDWFLASGKDLVNDRPNCSYSPSSHFMEVMRLPSSVSSSGLMEEEKLDKNETASVRWSAENAQGLRALVVLVKDVPSTPMLAHNHP